VLPASATYFTDRNVQGVTSAIFDHFVQQANDTPLNGLVLAGGRSERMGRDKAGLEYHGKPQVAHACDLLSDFCDDVMVSLRKEQVHHAAFAGLNLLPDRFVGFGPIGGILTALLEEPEAAWLVFACDLPYTDDVTLEYLVGNRNPFKSTTCYIASSGGAPEPLCAIYEPKSIYRLTGFLAQGLNDLRGVFPNSDSMLLELPGEDALFDVNTPEEYRSVQARLGGGYEEYE
jgi:molybdopterin-guanine dinucleotide biosynthesis protein A